MSSSQQNPHHNEDDAYIQAEDVEQVIEQDEDHPMDSDQDEEGDQQMDVEEQEITLENDSSAHFDLHNDSVFCIAQHPIHNSIVISGSGDDTAYIFDSTPSNERPLLPQSYESNPQPKTERESLQPLVKMDGHSDTVNAVAFTEPRGEYAVTAGLDGKLRVWRDTTPQLTGLAWEFVAESQEVEEINWVSVCPCAKEEEGGEKSNVIALGANDGSAWVFKIDHSDTVQPISIIQSFFQHTMSCTAGAWTPDGKLLATVSEDGTFYVYDVFGAAAAAGISYSAGTSAVVGLTPADQRFAVEGGLYSVAVAPSGTFAAVGGADGYIRVVGLPRLPSSTTPGGATKSKTGKSAQSTGGSASAAAAGTILASLKTQSEGIETLSFSSPPLSILASGSVDGSIALFDTAHRFAVRRHIKDAHDGTAVVKLEFLQTSSSPSAAGAASASRPVPRTPVAAASASGQGRPWLLTSVGMDGVVRRWDARGGTVAAAQGLLKEWKGHMPVSEDAKGEQSGGIMGFVQDSEGKRIVTAGDEGVVFVFEE